MVSSLETTWAILYDSPLLVHLGSSLHNRGFVCDKNRPWRNHRMTPTDALFFKNAIIKGHYYHSDIFIMIGHGR